MPLLALVIALLVFAALDNLVFRSGFYGQFCTPSWPGCSFFHLARVESQPVRTDKKRYLLVGNSQIEYGFSFRQFETEHPNSPVEMVPGGVGTTHEKSWYYMLRTLDPHRDKYDAIVLTVPNYRIPGWPGDLENSPDLTAALAPALPTAEWPDLIQNFTNREARKSAIRLALVSGRVYALDLQDFILHPLARLELRFSPIWKNADWRYVHAASAGNMVDMRYDETKGITVCAKQWTYQECRAKDGYFLRRSRAEVEELTVVNERYYAKWLGRILDFYRGSRTQIIMVQMPRWPFPIPQKEALENAPDLRTMFSGRANVTFLDNAGAEALEKPEYFYDELHLNAEGMKSFTTWLGSELLKR